MKALLWISIGLAMSGVLSAQESSTRSSGAPPAATERMFLPHDMLWGYGQFDLANLRGITMLSPKPNSLSSANITPWLAPAIPALPPDAPTGIIPRCATAWSMAIRNLSPA